MSVEFTCFVMLVINVILGLLIFVLIKKFKVTKLKNYIRQLEMEKLEDHEEILELQYEISLVQNKQMVPNRVPAKFATLNMN
jgi:hypothetical protein